jgi:polar amino acid transport system substrate-binding protein
MKLYRRLGVVMLLPLLIGISAFAPRHALSAARAADGSGVLRSGVLQWGADATGGAPYVFPDPKNPNHLIGFEVDIANDLARLLHLREQMVQTTWDLLPAALQHKRFDMIMNGLEVTPEREKVLAFSTPYYVYTEQVVVQKNNTTIHGFADLAGHKVGTGTGYKADDIMHDYNAHHAKQITIKEYDTDLPFADLDAGRLDAIFIDLPIAAYYGLPPIDDKLKLVGPPVDPGYYGIAFLKSNSALRTAIDGALAAMIKDGSLAKIYRHWNMWSAQQRQIGLR